jgi:FixJ family two-component response regulator
MQSAGFDAQAFSCPKKFFESVTFTENDCIILDLCMTGVSGFDVLLNLSLQKIKVPVIVVSAFDDAQNRQRAQQLGAISFFRKPVDSQALIDAINWALEGKKYESK